MAGVLKWSKDLGDRMRRVAVDATKTAKALNSIGAIPDARPGFNPSPATARLSRDQQFSIDARRLGL